MSPKSPLRNSYRSAHHGAILNSEGQFDHFARQIEEVHLQNGYWRFCTYEDDRRAYQRGFSSPEDVLIAQDVGDGVHDEISLRWIPGKSDPTNTKASVGTASAHLETIYNERKLLGRSLAFKGRVPVYPISDNPKLVTYRLTRYGIQKGALSNTTLQSQSRRKSHTGETTTSSLHEDPPPSRPLGSASVAASTPVPQTVEDDTMQPPETNTPALLTRRGTVTPSASPMPFEEPSTIEPPDHDENLQNALCIQQQIQATPLPCCDLHDHMPEESLDASKLLPTTRSDDLGQQNKVDAVGGHRANHMFPDSRTDGPFIQCLADTPSPESQDTRSTLLPCIDCGTTETHESHCWIKKATPSSQPIEELSAADLRTLAESVAQFDPGPWTTHTETSLQPLDDPKTQIQGMAELIRGLGTFVECRELCGLSDQLLVLVWGLRCSGEIQSLGGRSIHSDIGPPYSDDVEMQDV